MYILPWEEDQLPGIPSLGKRRAYAETRVRPDGDSMFSSAPEPIIPAVAPPPIAPVQSPESNPIPSIERMKAHEAAMPKYKEPKVWQRLLAAGIGGLAGAVDAGGRVRVDERGAVSNILGETGYKRKLGEWDRQGDRLKSIASLEAQEEQAREKGRERLRKEAEDKATLEDKAHGRRLTDQQIIESKKRTEQMGQPKPRAPFNQEAHDRVLEGGGNKLQAIQAGMGQSIASEPAPVRSPERDIASRREAWVTTTGRPPEGKDYEHFALTGQFPPVPRPPRPTPVSETRFALDRDSEDRAETFMERAGQNPAEALKIAKAENAPIRVQRALTALRRGETSGQSDLEKLRDLITGSPTPGQPPAATPNATSTAPPPGVAAQFKGEPPGTEITFGNGQVWTNANGSLKRIK